MFSSGDILSMLKYYLERRSSKNSICYTWRVWEHRPESTHCRSLPSSPDVQAAVWKVHGTVYCRRREESKYYC